jgi:CheY-like chemotaxis protein
LADYHLEKSNGLDAVMNLRWQYKTDIPAALVTADRSLKLREQAEARDMIVLNKPVKPAALRAFLNRNLNKKIAAE